MAKSSFSDQLRFQLPANAAKQGEKGSRLLATELAGKNGSRKTARSEDIPFS